MIIIMNAMRINSPLIKGIVSELIKRLGCLFEVEACALIYRIWMGGMAWRSGWTHSVSDTQQSHVLNNELLVCYSSHDKNNKPFK